jgi:hypothetical protein
MLQTSFGLPLFIFVLRHEKNGLVELTEVNKLRSPEGAEETKALIRAKASQRTEEVKEKYRKASSIPVTVFNLDGSVKGTYSLFLLNIY